MGTAAPRNRIDWLSTPEAASMLGVTPRFVYRAIDDGSLPAYQMGRVVRIKRADCDEFLSQLRISPNGRLDVQVGWLMCTDGRLVPTGDVHAGLCRDCKPVYVKR